MLSATVRSLTLECLWICMLNDESRSISNGLEESFSCMTPIWCSIMQRENDSSSLTSRCDDINRGFVISISETSLILIYLSLHGGESARRGCGVHHRNTAKAAPCQSFHLTGVTRAKRAPKVVSSKSILKKESTL
jgi:hypothetical protein